MNEVRQCRATAKSTGSRCRRAAVPGSVVCNRHGGAAGQVKRAAARRVTEAAAAREAVRLGLVDLDDVDPVTALLREVARASAVVDWLAGQVSDLDPGEVVGERQAHPLLDLWRAEREQLTRASAAAIRAGCSERQVRLAEEQAQLLAEVIRRVLGDPELGLPPGRQALTDRIVFRHLSAIGSGEAAS